MGSTLKTIARINAENALVPLGDAQDMVEKAKESVLSVCSILGESDAAESILAGVYSDDFNDQLKMPLCLQALIAVYEAGLDISGAIWVIDDMCHEGDAS